MSTSAHFAFQPQPRTDINRRTSTTIGHPPIVRPNIDRRTLPINYLPIVPRNINHLKNLEFKRGPKTNTDHIIDQSMFHNFPDNLKQGLRDYEDPSNILGVPRRLNDIKGNIQQTSQGLNNTIVFVSWGADEKAKSVDDTYLIVKLESKLVNHNKIKCAPKNVSIILRDPWIHWDEEDDTNYMGKLKEIIKGFDTNPWNIIRQLRSSNFQLGPLIQLIV